MPAAEGERSGACHGLQTSPPVAQAQPPREASDRRNRAVNCPALGGEWRCTGAGTAGTWIQIRPAAVTADPATGTIPTGYLILNVATGHIKRHAGGYVCEVLGV